MDGRIEAGVKAGLLSLITLFSPSLIWIPLLAAGFLAVLLGRRAIRSRNDVILSTIMAGIVSAFIYTFIMEGSGTMFIVVCCLVCTLFLIEGVICAKYVLRIPIDIHRVVGVLRQVKGLRIPVRMPRLGKPVKINVPFSRKFCYNCGQKIEDIWKVCPHCKTSLEVVLCPRCGSSTLSALPQCQYCGCLLGGVAHEGTRVY